jgi:hypothetical protein
LGRQRLSKAYPVDASDIESISTSSSNVSSSSRASGEVVLIELLLDQACVLSAPFSTNVRERYRKIRAKSLRNKKQSIAMTINVRIVVVATYPIEGPLGILYIAALVAIGVNTWDCQSCVVALVVRIIVFEPTNVVAVKTFISSPVSCCKDVILSFFRAR